MSGDVHEYLLEQQKKQGRSLSDSTYASIPSTMSSQVQPMITRYPAAGDNVDRTTAIDIANDSSILKCQQALSTAPPPPLLIMNITN